MSDRNNIIQTVASLISDRVDGDTVLLIDSYIPVALKTVCKLIAVNKPVGHEHLLERQSVTSVVVLQDTNYDFPYVDLHSYGTVMGTNPIVIQDRLFLVEYEGANGNVVRASPVGSYHSLRLATTHDEAYYYIEGYRMYIASGVTDINSLAVVYVTHYLDSDITNFPEELEDILIVELFKLVQMEASKQQLEKSNV